MRLTALLLVLSLAATACAGSDSPSSTDSTNAGGGTVTGMFLASDLDREEPAAPASDVATVAEGLRQFAADLYLHLQSDGNLVFSPISVYTALAMAYAGAAGTTAEELAGVLGGELTGDRFHSAINALDQALAARNRAATEYEGAVEISIANSLWGQSGMAFEDLFLDPLARDYGSGMRVVDFVDPSAREQARLAINEWVAGETEGRIEDLIQSGVLDDLVRMVLVNAVYLNAAWQTPFEEPATSYQPFMLLDGSEVSTEMMRQQLTLAYGAGGGWQAVRIPYAGDDLGMLVVVPDAGSFQLIEAALTDGLLDNVSVELSHEPVLLSLPKFEIRTQAGLVPPLQALGLREATSADADFSGMTGAPDLFISDVVHEAWISADEAGTEAAAATAVIMSLTGAPQEPIEFTVDRPFIFVLEDIQTGSILFIGRVVDPRA